MNMARLIGMLLVVAVVTGADVPSALGQAIDESLKKDIEALKEGQAAIRKELQELKQLLGARPAPSAGSTVAPADVSLSIHGAPAMGDSNARLTLVDFSDYQCPFCRRHVQQTLPEVVREYVNTGKVRYIFRDFPITSLHPRAPVLHQAAYCAGDQNRYWDMHARLFQNPQQAEVKDLVGHAQALGLDVARFEQCLTSRSYAEKVNQGVTDGQRAGVQGTPTFFIGVTEAGDSAIKAKRAIRGAQPYAVFKRAIEDVLGEGK
jgi:protein-disulfide isomerase